MAPLLQTKREAMGFPQRHIWQNEENQEVLFQ